MSSRFKSRRYLGLVLSGAKNQKTAMACLEFFPKERKIFLLDIFDKLGADESSSSDEALIDLIDECRGSLKSLAVNVPLSFPPCTECQRKTCPLPAKCTVPAVKWMRQTLKRSTSKKTSSRLRDLTPYTERPADVWLEHLMEKSIPTKLRFEHDETLGGAKAPLTARMIFLKRHLKGIPLLETNPKLIVTLLGIEAGVPSRYIARHRNIQDGAYSRGVILEKVAQSHGIFVYERDAQRLSKNLGSFDAFFCALQGYLHDQDLSQDPPKNYPKSAGWVSYPKIL